MLDSLYIAATGMHAEQSQIDTIANNLANLNTTAFKKSRVSFDDLLYRTAVVSSSEIDQFEDSSKVGMGSSVGSITKNFANGDLKATNNPLDVAISGKGFIEVLLDNGEPAYTRNGALAVNEQGYLQTMNGYQLAAKVQLPPDATEVFIRENGTVEARIDNSEDLLEVGQIDMVSFLNDSSLNPVGDNLFIATEESGQPMYSTAGEDGAGTLKQGFLEGSNVDLVEEMMNLVVAQRAYEVNSQIVKATDEMLRISNNLRS
jgi:flagellar basal-body rod protein FlgG